MLPWVYLFVAAELISLGAFLFLMVTAFRKGIGWALLVFFVPFGALAFSIKYWSNAGWRFSICALSYIACITIFLTHLELFDQHGRFAALGAAMKHAGLASAAPEKLPDDKKARREAVDVAEVETQLSRRDELIAQQTAYDRHAAELAAAYAQLNAERAKLKGPGPAMAAFNVKAARYQENLRALGIEKVHLDTMERILAPPRKPGAPDPVGPAARLAANTNPDQGAAVSAPAESAAASASNGNPAFAGTRTNFTDTPPTRASMDAAVHRVQAIVNQVPAAVSKPDGAESWRYTFHPGAVKPDFDKADIVSARELWLHEYIDMDSAPTVFYRGPECEFNSQTKFFYTRRDVPKKRLTDAEIQELVGLYRYLGKCQRELGVTL